MVVYINSLEHVKASQLEGFFVGWAAAPSNEVFLQALRGSSHVWLALESGRVVGLINAISDGVMAAFIPCLEVLPSHQQQGIGQELVRRMLETLSPYYSVDLLCDDELVPFYQRFGLQRANAMFRRNYFPSYELKS
jgi:predicted N-acetyltransferase YhbS